MFCYQCEQTMRDNIFTGCVTDIGACGKDATTSDLQDILIYQIKGIAQYARRARTLGVVEKGVDDFIQYGFFTTLTNVNFTATRFAKMVEQAANIRDGIKEKYIAAANEHGVSVEELDGPAAFQPRENMDDLLKQADIALVNAGHEEIGEDVNGLRMLVLYGMKGVCAYSHHARMLGYQEDEIDAEAERILDYLADNPTDIEELLTQALAVGHLNLRVMDMLDRANNGTFGNQEFTTVRITPVAGKAILVSGHDLHDLSQILQKT